MPFCRISLSGVSPCKLRLIYRASIKSLISSMRLLFVLIAPKNNFDWQKNLLLTTYRTCDVKNPKSDIFFCSPFICDSQKILSFSIRVSSSSSLVYSSYLKLKLIAFSDFDKLLNVSRFTKRFFKSIEVWLNLTCCFT